MDFMSKASFWSVNVPVADLRKEPLPYCGSERKEPLQETQLLYGDRVIVHEEVGKWAYIQAIDQEKFCSKQQKWLGYPGWIRRDQLVHASSFVEPNCITRSLWSSVFCTSEENPLFLFDIPFGARLHSVEQRGEWHWVKLSDSRVGKIHQRDVSLLSPCFWNRSELLEMAKLFVGFPYLWGGLSPWNEKSTSSHLTGVDCSGLVYLLYRLQGINVPRDAHDQFLKTERMEFDQLQMGDLVFLAEKERSERISHVMLYIQNDSLLEATLDSCNVRIVSGEMKLGKSLSQIRWGEALERYRVFFGSLC